MAHSDTVLTAPREGATELRTSPAPFDWFGVSLIAVAGCALLLAFNGRYGYHPDEMYFRMLGEDGPAWGYVDQPPALPMVVNAARALFGDNVAAIRVPAVVCAFLITMLTSYMAALIGGRTAAQRVTAALTATSMLTLTFGHMILTSSLDTVGWCILLVAWLRIVCLDDQKAWWWAGATVGLVLWMKLLILFGVACLLVSMLVVGPRRPLFSRDLVIGVIIGLVLGAPNLLYQAFNDFPQRQMAEALAVQDGETNRAMFAQNLVFILGPAGFVLVIIAVVVILRSPSWRAVRALPIAWLVATMAAFISDGGRPDYSGSFQLLLLAAGVIIIVRKFTNRRLAMGAIGAGMVLSSVLTILLAVPLVPIASLSSMQINSMSLESVGWPEVARRTSQVYNELPSEQRAHTAVLANNFGEAGALDRYGPEEGLPDQVYSGHNALHDYGPPPDNIDSVVGVGFELPDLSDHFSDCTRDGQLDNDWNVDNPERGRWIIVCTGRVKPWSEIWPTMDHLGAYR